MPSRRWWNQAEKVRGAPQMRGLAVSTDEWQQAAQDVAAGGGRLLALWATPGARRDSQIIYSALLTDVGVLILELGAQASAEYPSLESLFPAAGRMERAAFDLVGARSTQPDRRPWLSHTLWESAQPLRSPASASPAQQRLPETYDFVRVAGEGVHEIPVGPVHAGIIEPGHFRFSVVGEKVLRLEERLGYVHKGVERRFTELPLLDAHRLAARISGDSAVAYSWAYCQALEGVSDCIVPARAVWIRALCLELERMANHLGDLGALGNDAGFAVGFMQFMRLKERLVRAIEAALGQRYLLDVIVPGGVRADIRANGADSLAATVADICAESEELRLIYDEHGGMRDRFVDAGKLAPELAARLGVLGLVARASGQPLDARVDMPCPPYDELSLQKQVRNEGDVAARVALRFDELDESCRLVRRILMRLPDGPHATDIVVPGEGAFGVGLVEGWRGPVFVTLEAGAAGSIRRCHAHDPSWQNWLALEHAVIGNIVPDFPLINKSFNLSYSGHDL